MARELRERNCSGRAITSLSANAPAEKVKSTLGKTSVSKQAAEKKSLAKPKSSAKAKVSAKAKAPAKAKESAKSKVPAKTKALGDEARAPENANAPAKAKMTDGARWTAVKMIDEARWAAASKAADEFNARLNEPEPDSPQDKRSWLVWPPYTYLKEIPKEHIYHYRKMMFPIDRLKYKPTSPTYGDEVLASELVAGIAGENGPAMFKSGGVCARTGGAIVPSLVAYRGKYKVTFFCGESFGGEAICLDPALKTRMGGDLKVKFDGSHAVGGLPSVGDVIELGLNRNHQMEVVWGTRCLTGKTQTDPSLWAEQMQ